MNLPGQKILNYFALNYFVFSLQLPIPEYEIENVRILLSSPNGIEPSPYLNEGDWVEIICGPFTGVRGRLIERHGRRRLLVGIDLIQQAISVEVDMSRVRPLRGRIKGVE